MLGLRCELSVRFYGAAIVFFAVKTYATQTWESLGSSGAWAFHAFALGGGLALVFGARGWVLAVCALSGMRCWVSAFRPEEPLVWFPAAEWPLFVGLPLLALVGFGLSRGDRELKAWILIQVFRVSGAMAMAWSALHKLNWDFFEPSVTCARLSARLSEWWGLPVWMHGWAHPAVVVALEGLVPILLYIRPRWGFALLILLMAHFGSIGATALAWVLVATGVCFLPEEDIALAVRVGRKHWRVVGGVVLATTLLSFWAYRGPWSWPQYGLFHAAIAGVLTCWLWSAKKNWGATAHRLPWTRRQRAWVGILAVFWGLNGLSPYVGWKFQYSFAMLSNLRVDGNRWNSMWFQASDGSREDHHVEDHHVKVQRVLYWSAQTGTPLRGGALTPGLHSPDALRSHVARAREIDEWITMDFAFEGQQYAYLNASPQLTEAFVRALPPSGWWRPTLTLDGPQACVH